jgi:hypothetical protein
MWWRIKFWVHASQTNMLEWILIPTVKKYPNPCTFLVFKYVQTYSYYYFVQL